MPKAPAQIPFVLICRPEYGIVQEFPNLAAFFKYRISDPTPRNAIHWGRGQYSVLTETSWVSLVGNNDRGAVRLAGWFLSKTTFGAVLPFQFRLREKDVSQNLRAGALYLALGQQLSLDVMAALNFNSSCQSGVGQVPPEVVSNFIIQQFC